MASVRVAQACDACKMRKVKCNGQERCQQCTHLDLQCIYSALKQIRKPPQRGRIIQQYRDSTVRSLSASSYPLAPHPPLLRSPSSVSASASPKDSGSPPMIYSEYSQQFFLDLIPNFKISSLPFHPVVDEQELRDAIYNMHTSAEDSSFIHSFGALVMNHENGSEAIHHIRSLSTRAIETRPHPSIDDPQHSFSVRRIIGSVWIQNTMHTFRRFDLAFYYLREAISMIFILQLDDPTALANLPARERSRRQRLYWQIFIHERYLGIMNYQPVILTPLATGLPEYDETLPPGINEGFSKIIKIWALIDNDFVENWQQFRTGGVPVDADWFEAKHRQLDTEFLEDNSTHGDHATSQLSDMQRADITVTRQWLRTLLWQMAMSKCLLSSSAPKECMSLLFPLRLSQQLREMICRISADAIKVNGYGILQKMFEVTDAIADVIIHVPAANEAEARIRVDHFLYLFRLLVTFPRFVQTQKDILQEKCEVIERMFPETREGYGTGEMVTNGFADRTLPPLR